MKTRYFLHTQLTTIYIVFSLLVANVPDVNGQFIKLHDFSGNPDGYYPEGSLYYDGSFLFGMTYYGGTYNHGIIFKTRPDGSQYSKLFDFSSLNGSNPRLGALISDGTFLYGMTFSGGTNIYDGVIFKIKPDGTGYSKLHDFDHSDELNGGYPTGSLYFNDTSLYGMTNGGGATGYGVIFKIKPDGTEYTNLYSFTGNDGLRPWGSLISDGNYLYGMTSWGGLIGTPHGFGVIFRIKHDGSEYTKLMDFNGTNGKYPSGDLFFDGTFLYGMAGGGINEDGVIFKIKPDGSEYTKLWDFTNITGSTPLGSLIYNGIYLYGMTSNGGTNNNGVIFKIKPDGSEYTMLHDFPDTINGRRPVNSLISDGYYLYGMTYCGGTADSGIVFKYHPLGMGLPENNKETYFTVYPNPCANTVYIELTNAVPKEIDLFDITGKQVITTIQCQNRKTAIDVSGLNKGTYFLSLRTDKGMFYKKVIKY
jgi:uncharacterized repeat protein (TIGR03803 family)